MWGAVKEVQSSSQWQINYSGIENKKKSIISRGSEAERHITCDTKMNDYDY